MSLIAPSLDTLLGSAPAVLFDFDGVLVDSEACWFDATARAFAPHGHTLDRPGYNRHWVQRGAGLAGEIARHRLPLDAAARAALSRRRKRLYSAAAASGAVPVIAPVWEALAAWSSAGRPCAVASNSDEDDMRAIAAAAGRGFPCPWTGRRPGLRGKPSPDIFVHAAGMLGVPPAGCVVIEDTWKGLRAARAAGMIGVAVRTATATGDDLADAAAVAPDHAALVSALLDVLAC